MTTMQLILCLVAPHAGAWIETHCLELIANDVSVAPHAGAWIETFDRNNLTVLCERSRPTRARGLKLAIDIVNSRFGGVAPHAGAWIETAQSRFQIASRPRSRPTRARGLKRTS